MDYPVLDGRGIQIVHDVVEELRDPLTIILVHHAIPEVLVGVVLLRRISGDVPAARAVIGSRDDAALVFHIIDVLVDVMDERAVTLLAPSKHFLGPSKGGHVDQHADDPRHGARAVNEGGLVEHDVAYASVRVPQARLVHHDIMIVADRPVPRHRGIREIRGGDIMYGLADERFAVDAEKIREGLIAAEISALQVLVKHGIGDRIDEPLEEGELCARIGLAAGEPVNCESGPPTSRTEACHEYHDRDGERRTEED